MTDDQLNRLSSISISLAEAQRHIDEALQTMRAMTPMAGNYGLRLALQQADININAAIMSAMAVMERNE